MPQYTTAQLLTDGNGNPIPQEYDPATDSFAPKTTKSIVEVVALVDFAQAPKDYSIIHQTAVSDYKHIFLAAKADTAHSFSYQAAWIAKTGGYWLGKSSVELSTQSATGVTDWINIRGDSVALYLVNDDTVTHTYQLYVYGVR